MDILNSVIHILFKCDDPRIRDWIIFNTPYPVSLVLFAYIYFVFVCGPRFMKNRKPYSLKAFIRFYDLFQILLNSIIVYQLFKGGWYSRIWIYCVPITYESSPENNELLLGCWLALISKIVDLIETGIFVLRKKEKQISFLHLYHHMSTLFIGWVFGKNHAAGMAIVVPLVNCSVHVIMYIYYFLSSIDGNIRSIINKYKHWVTIIQMTQFVILTAHSFQGLLPSCDVPTKTAFIVTLNYVINFFLFYNFYKNTYLKKDIKQN